MMNNLFLAPDTSLLKQPPVPPRHCPICGIAMQGHKSSADRRHFDVFECLNCDTTIRVSRPADKGPTES